MKFLLQPYCVIITTLEKRLEELGSYINVLTAPSTPPVNPLMERLDNSEGNGDAANPEMKWFESQKR